MVGIKVWVFIGDKYEIVVSVSLLCGYFYRIMNIFEFINQKLDSECVEQLRQFVRRIIEDYVIQYGLVVDGISLFFVFREYEKLFMEVCRNCLVVLCCCMVLLQKVKVIRLIKILFEKFIILVVGDGVNDVSMI